MIQTSQATHGRSHSAMEIIAKQQNIAPAELKQFIIPVYSPHIFFKPHRDP